MMCLGLILETKKFLENIIQQGFQDFNSASNIYVTFLAHKLVKFSKNSGNVVASYEADIADFSQEQAY